MTLAQKIIAAIGGPEGGTRDEILLSTGHKYTCVDAKLPQLVRRGKIFRVRVLGQRVRYFADERAAVDWESKQTPVDAVEVQIMRIVEANLNAGHSSRSIWRCAQHFGKDTISRALGRMRESGELYAVVCGQHGLLHFKSREMAEKVKASYQPRTREKKLVATKATAAKARASITRERPKDTREIITPSHVKVQQVGVIVSGDIRYQVQPGEKVPAVFSKIPLGATLYGMAA